MPRINFEPVSLLENGFDQQSQLANARFLLDAFGMRVVDADKQAKRTGKPRQSRELDVLTFGVSDTDSMLRMPAEMRDIVIEHKPADIPVVRLYGEYGAQTQLGFALVNWSPKMISRSPGTYAEIAAAAHAGDASYTLATEKFDSAIAMLCDNEMAGKWGLYDAGMVYNALARALRKPVTTERGTLVPPVNYSIRALHGEPLKIHEVVVPQYGVRILLDQNSWANAPIINDDPLVGMEFWPTLARERNGIIDPSDFIHGTARFIRATYPDDIVKP